MLAYPVIDPSRPGWQVDPRWRSARGEALASARLGGALEGALPLAAAFPFPLRVAAEALSADGGALAAAVTSGSLALSSAGVQQSRRVAGALPVLGFRVCSRRAPPACSSGAWPARPTLQGLGFARAERCRRAAAAARGRRAPRFRV